MRSISWAAALAAAVPGPAWADPSASIAQAPAETPVRSLGIVTVTGGRPSSPSAAARPPASKPPPRC